MKIEQDRQIYSKGRCKAKTGQGSQKISMWNGYKIGTLSKVMHMWFIRPDNMAFMHHGKNEQQTAEIHALSRDA